MNYLQICQRIRRKCRISGSGPTTVVGTQVEEYARILDWANESWMYLQTMRPDWLWMRTSMTFPTVLNQASYTLANIGITDFGNWDTLTFRNYVTATGQASEIDMEYLPYDKWREKYQFGAIRFSPTRPIEFTVTPNLSIGLGPVPIAGYTVTGDYFKVPTEMSTDADIPGIPVQFHMLIVYKAMMYYGASEAAPEVYQEGETEFNKMLARMTVNQLADFELGGPLS